MRYKKYQACLFIGNFNTSKDLVIAPNDYETKAITISDNLKYIKSWARNKAKIYNANKLYISSNRNGSMSEIQYDFYNIENNKLYKIE